jgi:hypothetical protein
LDHFSTQWRTIAFAEHSGDSEIHGRSQYAAFASEMAE